MSLINKENVIDHLIQQYGIELGGEIDHNTYVSLDAVLRSIDDFPEVSDYKKCSSNGVIFKPDGVNELDPCFYDEIEEHRNVTVRVLRCRNCGHIELEWKRQWNTEDILEE